MGSMNRFERLFIKLLKVLCPPVYTAIYSQYGERKILKTLLEFVWGVVMGVLFYVFILRKIPFPYYTKLILISVICLLMGIANATSIQMRCICLLAMPMYCGKAGRGVLKAIVFTYVIAGPISNLGLNAREIVRVFACSSSLSYNLTETRYALMVKPFKQALFGMKTNIGEVKDTLRSIRDVAAPIEAEMEGDEEMRQEREENDYIENTFGDTHRAQLIDAKLQSIRDVAAPIEAEMEGDEEMRQEREENDYLDNTFGDTHRAQLIDAKFQINKEDEEKEQYEKKYLKKLEYRCQDQLSRGTAICMEGFAGAYDKCYAKMPWYAGWLLCWPMKLTFVCNIIHVIGGQRICDSRKQIDPGLGEGYMHFKKSTAELGKNFNNVKIQYHISEVHELVDIQDARETGKRVMHSFDEKSAMFTTAMSIVNALFALIFIRILLASQHYHDNYLVKIDYDNIYITKYFRTIDERRRLRDKYTLLPLKKMEKSKYVDVSSLKYVTSERSRLLCQAVKVLLEMMTATTFILLERLFYEALEVVREHAALQYTQEGTHDFTVEVEGAGMVAGIVRSVLGGLNSKARIRRVVSNDACLPNPRAMSSLFYLDIYGGYMWILVLMYFDAYTLRLRRLICSYFYPKREKQRILHLYNDLLKRRIKMKRTMCKMALRALRTHRLSNDDLLTWRLRFPQLLSWLKIFPGARNKCLICGETQPRSLKGLPEGVWIKCPTPRCPFVYCAECWRDAGHRCLACDPQLHLLSDEDSLSDGHPQLD